MKHALHLTPLLVGLLGCGLTAPGPGSAPAGGLSLTVVKAREVTRSGVTQVHVAVTLQNGAGAAPLSVNPVLFQLQDSAGVLVTGAPESEPRWVGGSACDPTVAIAGGATLTCDLQFSPQSAANPTTLLYRTANAITATGEDRRTASAPLTVEPCTTCGADCTYPDVDLRNCGACGTLATGAAVTCQGGRVTCAQAGLTACPPGAPAPVCVNLATDPANCGACGHQVDGPCAGGVLTCAAGQSPCPSNSARGPFCANLKTDSANCGTCGTQVPTAQACLDGQPGCRVGSYCASAMEATDPFGGTLGFAAECFDFAVGGAWVTAMDGRYRFQRCGACSTLLQEPVAGAGGGPIGCQNGVARCQTSGHTLSSRACGSGVVWSCN